MTASSWAGVIGAIGSVITAVGVLVTAFRLYPLLQHARQIHTIVNQQRTDVRELVNALAARGIAVPKDRSLDG